MNLQYLQQLFSLDGRKAVVTGAGSGIGRAAAVALANFGAEVILIGRNIDKLRETQMEIEKIPAGKCHSYSVDVSCPDAFDSFFEQYRKQHGNLDIYVSNAGINIREDAISITQEQFDTLFNTNFKGAWLGLKNAGAIMKEQRSGNIVIVTSVNGLSPLPEQTIYSTTKAALQSLMQGLAATLAPYGVRVNSCAPGCVLTSINQDIFSKSDIREDKRKKIPLGNLGQPEEIGNVIATMVSDAYSFMTGATVLVDGGEFLRPATFLGDDKTDGIV